MAYADYSYYTDTFRQGYTGGSFIGPDAFPYLSNIASLYVKSATKGLADRVRGDALEAVKMVTCAIAEVFLDEQTATAKRTDSGGGVVSSESVGSWSRSYATGVSSADVEYMDKRKADLLMLYLGALPEFAGLFRAKSYRCIHDAKNHIN